MIEKPKWSEYPSKMIILDIMEKLEYLKYEFEELKQKVSCIDWQLLQLHTHKEQQK